MKDGIRDGHFLAWISSHQPNDFHDLDLTRPNPSFVSKFRRLKHLRYRDVPPIPRLCLLRRNVHVIPDIVMPSKEANAGRD